MMNQQTHRCDHCGRRAALEAWCCDKAELEALRGAVDLVIYALDSEVTAPLIIDDGGVVREVVRHAATALRVARRVA